MPSGSTGSTVTEHMESVFGHEIRVVDVGSGRTDARRVYLQAGLHPNETTGCGVLHSLVGLLAAQGCPADVRIIPHVNPIGWRTYVETGNGRFSHPNFANWNRIFDGVPVVGDRPTLEARFAAVLLGIADGFDHVVDVHTPEFGWPHLYAADPSTRLTTFDDLPHVLAEPSEPTFADHHVLKSREPGSTIRRAVTLELPSHRPQSIEDLDHWAGRLHREILSIADSVIPTAHPLPMWGDRMIDLRAEFDGICYVAAEPGRLCRAGDLIATVVDPGGRRDDLRAEVDVVPLCYRRSTVARAGGWAVRCLAVDRTSR